MNPYPQIEPTSTAHLLTCMGLAIEETRLLRSIINFKNMAGKLGADDSTSSKLSYIDREIANLEEKLMEVRSLANRVELI